MTLAQIRTQVQGMLDIAENDIPNSVLDTFIAQGFDAIVYSEKRWPFFSDVPDRCGSAGLSSTGKLLRPTFQTVAGQY